MLRHEQIKQWCAIYNNTPKPLNRYRFNNRCIKCGGGGIDTEAETEFVRYYIDWLGYKPMEFIKRTCSLCGYSWAELPLDAEESEDVPD